MLADDVTLIRLHWSSMIRVYTLHCLPVILLYANTTLIQKCKINVQAFPLKENLKTTLCRCLLAGKNACFFGCTRLTQDTCTLHQRKYRSVIFITIKVLNVGTDRSDPDQTATNCYQSDQGLLCFVIPPITYTGICIHCNKEGRCMTID